MAYFCSKVIFYLGETGHFYFGLTALSFRITAIMLNGGFHS